MAEIVIDIAKDGKTKVEAVGYQGSTCSLATQPYVKALGIKDGELPKSEMFDENTNQQQAFQ